MSQLALYGRPWTVFDPSNKLHREWYHEFVKSGTWGKCPVRFVVPEDHGDLITMMQRNLIKYYVEQEFAKKQRRSITRPKNPRAV
jgi:hypothetical protein